MKSEFKENQRGLIIWPTKSSGYELINPIGQGSFGLVWLAKCCDENS